MSATEPRIPVDDGGRTRTTEARDVSDATLDLARTGCRRHVMPADSPPRQQPQA